MLKNIKDIYGMKLAATDGDIGHVKDFYFNDESWEIRYLIVDTGSWLPGRLVLLAPPAFDGLGATGEVLAVKLTKQQIEDSPSIESHLSVTRQHERDYYNYYSWPTYWDGGGMWGMGQVPIMSQAVLIDEEMKTKRASHDDPHLRSTKSVTGYDIEASDGSMGSVCGFMVDHQSWAIADLVVETGHWYSGKQILISTASVRSVSYDQSKVSVKLTRADVQRTPESAVAESACSNC